MTQVRFQADADLKQAIVTGVIRQQPTIDFQSANQAGLEGLQDAEVLALAAQQDRVLVTHDAGRCPLNLASLSRLIPVLGC
jgi:predicted nuclease of predicted toxin-antitoxin system